MVRLRQLVEQLRHRLLVLPALYVVAAVVSATVTIRVDRQHAPDVPDFLQTTVDGGRAVLTTIAGGLIAAITLLLSLTLVAVQLASSQFSPRTLRNWLGDGVLQRAIGTVLGTVVFCLLALHGTRDVQDVGFQPNTSVALAIVLGVLSLVVVVRSVDHLADSLRVGSVAQHVLAETLTLVHRLDEQSAIDRPAVTPAPRPVRGPDANPPPGAHIVETQRAGWVQQIDVDRLLRACPGGATLHVPVAVGAFTLPGTPLAWITPALGDKERIDRQVRDAVAVGDTRTMQQDIGFGILRMVDIALRALSPGINDPNTARDMVAHLGAVLLAVYEVEEQSMTCQADDREVHLAEVSHGEYVHAAFDQIRRAAIGEPEVLATMVRTIVTIRDSVERRSLPGPVEHLDAVLVEVAEDVVASELSWRDQRRVLDVVPPELRVGVELSDVEPG